MLDILLTNRSAVLDSLDRSRNQQEALRSALQGSDRQMLSDLLSAANSRRKELNQ
jgi:hypothetical protein